MRLGALDTATVVMKSVQRVLENPDQNGAVEHEGFHGDLGVDVMGVSPRRYISHSMDSARFRKAFDYAARLHATQTRKGVGIPYISHLMIVAGTVIEHGGNEDQAIAALLHDAIEDHPADGRTRGEILNEFGPRVLELVESCSDSDTIPKPPWRERKERYLDHLRHTTPDARLISLADKLHNARAILADYRQIGDKLWKRFNAPKQDTLWYYRELAKTFHEVQPGLLASELQRTVTALTDIAAEG